MELMLDTNIINALLDGQIELEALSKHNAFITAVQIAELKDTKRTERRDALLGMVKRVNPAVKQAAAVWGDAKWGQALWASDDSQIPAIQSRIQELDAAAKKIPRNEFNQSRDARIVDAAIRNKLILVTRDSTLATAAQEFGCAVMTPGELTNSTH